MKKLSILAVILLGVLVFLFLKTMLQTDFVEGDETDGVYYNYIEKVTDL